MKPVSPKGKLLVQNTLVSFTRIEQSDFISLTDIARVKNPDEPKDVVKNWLRSRSTLDFLGLWEKINNPDFKGVEFDSFKNDAGTNSFIPQIERLLALNNTAIHQMRSLLGAATVLKIR